MSSTESKFTIPATGTYRLWAVPVDQRHHVSILVNGDVVVDRISEVGPFSDAVAIGDRELAEGDEVTTSPANAHLAVSRLPDFKKIYDSAE